MRNNRRDNANEYKAKLEADIRQEILHGTGGRRHNLTIADAGLRYMKRPGGIRSYDFWLLAQINEVVGDYSVARAAEAWTEFRRVHAMAGIDLETLRQQGG